MTCLYACLCLHQANYTSGFSKLGSNVNQNAKPDAPEEVFFFHDKDHDPKRKHLYINTVII